jgi:hypothetical protein
MRDAPLELCPATFHLGGREVLVPVVHRNGDFGKQSLLAALQKNSHFHTTRVTNPYSRRWPGMVGLIGGYDSATD